MIVNLLQLYCHRHSRRRPEEDYIPLNEDDGVAIRVKPPLSHMLLAIKL